MIERNQKLQASPPKPAPPELAGQWVAWNRQRTEIIAHGPDMAGVHQAAIRAGHPDAVLQRVCDPELRFIAGRGRTGATCKPVGLPAISRR
jgi:hypothetical protein